MSKPFFKQCATKIIELKKIVGLKLHKLFSPLSQGLIELKKVVDLKLHKLFSPLSQGLKDLHHLKNLMILLIIAICAYGLMLIMSWPIHRRKTKQTQIKKPTYLRKYKPKTPSQRPTITPQHPSKAVRTQVSPKPNVTQHPEKTTPATPPNQFTQAEQDMMAGWIRAGHVSDSAKAKELMLTIKKTPNKQYTSEEIEHLLKTSSLTSKHGRKAVNDNTPSKNPIAKTLHF